MWQFFKVNKVMDFKKVDVVVINIYIKGGIDVYIYDGYDGVYGYLWYFGIDLNWWNIEVFEKYGFDFKKLLIIFDEFYV